MTDALSAAQIRRLFELLNDELQRENVRGELYVVGGAVMCLAFSARPSTRDVDAIFQPVQRVRAAAERVAAIAHCPVDWLNDGVKGFLSERASFKSYLDLGNLKVFVATPEYLLAMKCLAMRIGEEFHDVEDVRYLLRHLNIGSYEQALNIIGGYYPIERFPQKTLYALEELVTQINKT